MSDLAQLLVTAVRWSSAHGYDDERMRIDRALEIGVGGFVVHGGTDLAARALITDLRRRSRAPLLIAAELERGAAQQFAGTIGLPPLAAIASLDDIDALRRAARITARDARTLGVNWILAPVCDLDIADGRALGTRALGSDGERAAALAAEWIDASQAEGVLACAKHFPGAGRGAGDASAVTPVVDADTALFERADLLPFGAAIDAGVGSIMMSRAAYPALDASGAAASRSRAVVTALARERMGFDGLIAADLSVGRVDDDLFGDERVLGVDALSAGCDLLLQPDDPGAVLRAIESAARDGVLDGEQLRASVARRARWASWGAPSEQMPGVDDSAAGWARALADRCVTALRGALTPLPARIDVIVVAKDDDAAPHAAHELFLAALHAEGYDAVRAIAPSTDPRHGTVIALFRERPSARASAPKSDATRRAVADACAVARDAVVVLFGHPRVADDIPEARTVLCAWGSDRPMQEAAARAIARATR